MAKKDLFKPTVYKSPKMPKLLKEEKLKFTTLPVKVRKVKFPIVKI